MTPRNTKQGASAKARRASSPGVTRAASPIRASSVSAARSASKSSSATRGAAATKPTRPKKTPKRPEPSSWRWWLLPVMVLSLLAIFVATYYPVAKVQYRETRERERLRAELAGVHERNDRLATEVARLKTPEGVEDYARVQLGLVKAGEQVGVVVDESVSLPTTIAVLSALELDSEETVLPPVGPWTAFLDSVFGSE